MEITRKSEYSGIARTMELPITQEQIDNHANGMRIQEAMSNLDANQREFYITGITAEEWDELFPPDDEEDLEDRYTEEDFLKDESIRNEQEMADEAEEERHQSEFGEGYDDYLTDDELGLTQM